MPETSGPPVATGDFRIEEEPHGTGLVFLAIYGDTDLHVAKELGGQLSSAIAARASSLVIDLTGVTFIDSMGLGALLGTMKRLEGKGGQFRLVVPKGDIRRVFEMTLLDRVFEIHATRDAALAAARSSSAR